jgi:hypothetical protein
MRETKTIYKCDQCGGLLDGGNGQEREHITMEVHASNCGWARNHGNGWHIEGHLGGEGGLHLTHLQFCNGGCLGEYFENLR